MAGLNKRIKLKYLTGIRTRLTIIILCVTIIPLGLVGFWSYNTQKEIITREVTASHIELSNTLARGIYENLEPTRKLLNSVCELKFIQSLNPEVSKEFFNS
ncbi:MAG: hypothetical protein J6Z11_14805, partial [Candidatus Riflebacteria bacterium]|nr:hypothetical protein [Candidatus Riflebacteria bacterium]